MCYHILSLEYHLVRNGLWAPWRQTECIKYSVCYQLEIIVNGRTSLQTYYLCSDRLSLYNPTMQKFRIGRYQTAVQHCL